MKVHRHVLGFGGLTEYAAGNIKDFRTVPFQPALEIVAQFSGKGRRFDGPIAFDNGSQTLKLGAGVDEAEAQQIVALIQQRFPQYWTTPQATFNPEPSP
jgi:hypothetical protein